MSGLSASKTKANLYRLINQVAESHNPIHISGKRNGVVLLPATDWAAIQETMYLLNIPAMRESIRESMQIPIENCATELDW